MSQWIDRVQESPRFARWLNRRVPPTPSHTLGLNNIFIVPTGQGFLFVLCALVVWVAGINYQNTLMLALAFYMFAMFLVVMVQTYQNLAGLTLTLSPPSLVEVGRRDFSTLMATSSHDHHAIDCAYPREMPRLLEVERRKQNTIQVPICPSKRGVFNPGRLRLETRYPQGLFRAWSLIEFSNHSLAYPSPVQDELPEPERSEGTLESARPSWARSDAKVGAKIYQPGDDTRTIDWRVSARFSGLYVKEFEAPVAHQRTLSWEDYPFLTFEAALQRLAYWAIELTHRELDFSLVLPGRMLPRSQGERHLEQALGLLAVAEEKSSL
ncbi:MAG: DUF58 domain-containing protein [Pseudomonadales bacterium]